MNIADNSGLRRADNGIWVAERSHQTSFPADGNARRKDVEQSSFWYQHRNTCLLSLLKNYPPEGAVLDIGGGNGTVDEALIDAGYSAILLEPEMSGALEARQKGIADVICSTLVDADFAISSIPAAGMFDVLEHIEDSSGFLRYVHSRISQNGRLYITVPAFSQLWSNSDVESGHYRRYTRTSLSKELTSAGYELEYCSYIFSTLVLPMFFARTLPDLFRRGGSAAVAKRQHQHKGTDSMTGRLLMKLLSSETAKIRQRKPIRFGTSCLAVARKSK